MAEEGSSSLRLGRKDGVYAALIAAIFGGGQVLDQHRVAGLETLTEKVASLERNVSQLQDPGGPRLRQLIQQVATEEERLTKIDGQITEIQSTRLDYLKTSVSQETIAGLRQQLTDAKEGARDLKQQIETLRQSIENLRADILRQTTMRLKGPER